MEQAEIMDFDEGKVFIRTYFAGNESIDWFIFVTYLIMDRDEIM